MREEEDREGGIILFRQNKRCQCKKYHLLNLSWERTWRREREEEEGFLSITSRLS